MAFIAALTIALFLWAYLVTLGPRPLANLVCSRITSLISGSISAAFSSGLTGFCSMGVARNRSYLFAVWAARFL